MRKFLPVAIAFVIGAVLLLSGHESALSDEVVEIPVDQVWDAWISVDEPCPSISPLPGGTTVAGIDSNPTGNTADSLGAIDRCISVESVDTGPDVAGPVFEIDTFVDEIPWGRTIAGFEYHLNFEDGTIIWQDHFFLLDILPGSTVVDGFSEGTPDSESPHYTTVADAAPPAADEAGPISGVLGRYTFDVSDALPGTHHLALTGVILVEFIPDQPTPTPEPLKYLATGDSIPAGADLTGRGWKKERYPAVLCDELKSAGPAEYSNISKTGHTTDDYLKKQLIKAIKAQPDLITVTVGADDILESFLHWRVFRGCDIPASTANLRGILNSLLQHTDALVVVTGYYNPVNPSNLWPHLWGNMEACVLEGNNAIHEVVTSLSSDWPGRLVEVRLYDKFKGHEFGTAHPWIAGCRGVCGRFPGGIHPNVDGHRAIATAILEELGY